MKKGIKKTGVVLALIFFLVNAVFPIYWMFVTSLKSRQEIYSEVPTLWPKDPSFQNYIEAFSDAQFGTYMRNSFIVTIVTSVLVVLIAIMGGYAMARMKFKGKNAVMAFLLGSQMISALTILVPLFNMFSTLNLIDNLASLMICYTVFNVPFCLITMSSFFKRIPVALEEAACIDGCSRFTAVRKIILPIMMPGIIATFVFAFTGAWNEMFLSIMLINRNGVRTIPAGLMNFVQKFDINWGQMSAASIASLVPIACMFLIVQRYVVDGLTAGAVKE